MLRCIQLASPPYNRKSFPVGSGSVTKQEKRSDRWIHDRSTRRSLYVAVLVQFRGFASCHTHCTIPTNIEFGAHLFLTNGSNNHNNDHKKKALTAFFHNGYSNITTTNQTSSQQQQQHHHHQQQQFEDSSTTRFVVFSSSIGIVSAFGYYTTLDQPWQDYDE